MVHRATQFSLYKQKSIITKRLVAARGKVTRHTYTVLYQNQRIQHQQYRVYEITGLYLQAFIANPLTLSSKEYLILNIIFNIIFSAVCKWETIQILDEKSCILGLWICKYDPVRCCLSCTKTQFQRVTNISVIYLVSSAKEILTCWRCRYATGG